MGWRSRHLDSWSLRLELGLTPSNKHCADGTHNGEVSRHGLRDKGAANDPRDSRTKDKLITSRRIPIDIYKGEYKVRGKVNSEVLDEGQQKASMRLSNRIIVRQRM